MALLAGTGLFLIQTILPQVPSRRNMLSISRMSMCWPVDDFIAVLDGMGLPHDEAVAETMREKGAIYTGKEFFTLLGFEKYDDMDFTDSEGATIVHNLNEPMEKDLHGRFDFVFENGTLEHIFDIKTALSNIANAVAVGGYVSHSAPLDAFNHGFFNFSINAFNDFYRVNGFTDFKFYLLRYASDWQRNQNVLPEELPYSHEEFFLHPHPDYPEFDKAYISFLARKAEQVETITTPIQAAYDPALRLSGKLKTW